MFEFLWIVETLTPPGMYHRFGSATVAADFPQGKQPKFPWEKSHWDNTVSKIEKKKKKWHDLFYLLEKDWPWTEPVELASFPVGKGAHAWMRRSKINFLVSPQEPLLATLNRQETETCMVRTSHTPKTTRQGTLEGGQRSGQQRKCLVDNIKEWTSLPMPELLTRASSRKDWKSPCWIVRHVLPPDNSIGQGTELESSQIKFTVRDLALRWPIHF